MEFRQAQNFPITTATTKTNAAAVTYTAEELLGGLILRDPNGSARTDTTPTAAQIKALMDPGSEGALRLGQTFDVLIRNTADASETITLAGGTGVTISGTATIAQSNSKIFRFVYTANPEDETPTFTAYSVGTFVH